MRLYMSDILRGLVADVSTELLNQLRTVDSNITGVHYQQGHPLEVVNALQLLANNTSTKTERYPLVALYRDFIELKDEQDGVYSSSDLHIIVATRTRNYYTTEQRAENSFKPILHPIVDALITKISLSPKFLIDVDKVKRTETDRYFWGKDGLFGAAEKNMFQDWIDCVEIKMNLKTLIPKC
jgi:hypothetical protein